MWWCPRGYACVRVDSRGSGKSPGQVGSELVRGGGRLLRRDRVDREAADWCSGNIGTLGVSYHANCQWRVANLQPPSLKAIIPWEGPRRSLPRPDLPRRHLRHGLPADLDRHQHGAPPDGQAAHLQSRTPSTTTCCGSGRATASIPSSGACAAPTGTSITVPMLQRRQLDRHGPAPARQHRRLRATPPRSTRSCASTAARISIPSTRRKGASTSCASSTTG